MEKFKNLLRCLVYACVFVIIKNALTMLSVKRALTPTSVCVSESSVKRARVSDSSPPLFLRNEWSSNTLFDVDVSKNGNDFSVRVRMPSTNYAYRMFSPPCPVKYSDLAPGGNFGRFASTKTESAAKLSVTLNMLQEDKFVGDRKLFLDHLTSMNDTILDTVFEKHDVLRNLFMGKAKSLLKSKKKADVQATAKKLFKKAARIPIKVKDGETLISASCKAFSKNDEDEYVERPVTFYKYKKKSYTVQESITISKNDLIGVVLQPSFYVLPGNASFGISYRLDNRSVVLFKRSPASQGCSNAVLNDNQRDYAFKFAKDNVYINDAKGRHYQVRTPPMKVKYCDLVDGTLGKFPGVTESNASLTASLEPLPESSAWFEHFQQLTKDCGTFLFNHPQCLASVKEELLSTAKDMAEEMGQTVETAHKNMFLSNFKLPIKDGVLKLSQRMFNKLNIRNVIPIVDKDGNHVQETIQRGAIIQVCMEPSVYMLPNGTCGIKCNIDLKNGITLLDNPTQDETNNNTIYDISDSDEED